MLLQLHSNKYYNKKIIIVVQGTHLQSMYCRFVGTAEEENPLISTITFNKIWKVACSCSRIVQGLTESPTLGCELITTTCPLHQDIIGKLEVS